MDRRVITAFSSAFVLAFSLMLTSCSSDPGSADENSAADSTEAPVTEVTEAETAVPPVFVEVQNSDIHKGELILVNRDNEYSDGSNQNIVNIYENKSDSYKVDRSYMELDKTMIGAINSMLDDFAAQSGITNILCNSGYRSYDEQKQMYDEDLENTGLLESDLVAPPGHSEHHTGYAMDFAIDDGYEYPALRNEGEYSWIYSNAAKYGLILRYTEQNKHITKYRAESWHFRYVGPVHASMITKMGVALEQYIGFIKDFQFENPLEYKYSDTEFYRIYYVPMNTDADKTSLPIPYECLSNNGAEWPYTVSGNNSDGFIVTVKIPELSPDYDDTFLYMFSPAADTIMASDDYQNADDTVPENDDAEENAEEADDSEDKVSEAAADEETGW
ncbi:M15 family metallopeptidase [Ruminococcus sp. HUN007]|uniref:M15 family metallopeptidase n=1 Tax=Ruminococcus sp. HUN007 TaxID=1514668 RepID=UPI0005D1B4C7|nr:M15 family metallopeptidase [Ruminococcus sp. HUN007]